MGKITAVEVNKLRKMSGAGIMDCKKALVESNGDFDSAIEILRKKGQKVAAKRADRESSEGAVIAKVSSDFSKGVIISLNCETDFVAKNEGFLELANNIAEAALECENLDELLKCKINSISISEKLLEQTGVIGEKLVVGNFEKLSSNYVGKYIHAGNKIATLSGFSLNINGVDKQTIDKEIEIAKDQLRQEGKPELMLDNIAKGKLKRFFKDNTLINQDFIKDNKQSVSAYIKSFNEELKVVGFKRVSLL